MTKSLRLPAIEVRQGPKRLLYQFAVDGKLLDTFASVSRIRRDDNQLVEGYQRPEALKHIAAIQRYIESDNPMIPNGIVIAFDSRVSFSPAKGPNTNGEFSRPGTLDIPLAGAEQLEGLPGWIVDGQQRTAAIRNANVDAFPIPVTAFITDNQAEQREQFILVNSAKPLSKSLIYELLPSTDAFLPAPLARRKLSAQILERLNYDSRSPFHRRIQTPTNPDGVIKDNSVLRMLDNSTTDGVLYNHRDPLKGLGDVERMASYVNNFWTAAATVFPDDWAATPRRSRLVHGIGIVAMGYLMDAISDRHYSDETPTIEIYETEIRRIADNCHWSNGEWDFGGRVTRRWNELQNTSRDIQLVANHLLITYRAATRPN